MHATLSGGGGAIRNYRTLRATALEPTSFRLRRGRRTSRTVPHLLDFAGACSVDLLAHVLCIRLFSKYGVSSKAHSIPGTTLWIHNEPSSVALIQMY